MVEFKHRGNFNNTEKFLNNAKKVNLKSILESYGQKGVQALASATPTDSGLTANSWGYDVKINKGSISLTWTNSNTVNGIPIVILIQHGHGTKNGGFVQGRDFINPAIQPIFDKLSEAVWKEVTKK